MIGLSVASAVMKCPGPRETAGPIHAKGNRQKSCPLRPILPDKSERTNMDHLFSEKKGDPPYSDKAGRNMDCYAIDSGTIAYDVLKFCEQWGHDNRMRICLAGYEGEGHEVLVSRGWRVHKWKASGGYENSSQDNDGPSENCRKERLWFSPHCLENQKELF